MVVGKPGDAQCTIVLAPSSSAAAGVGPTRWPAHGGPHQQSDFAPSGDGYHRIRARHSGLVLQEAIGSFGRRCFRSFASTGLTGSWSPPAATEDEPFAGRADVTFPGGTRTQHISRGELLRAGNDQTPTVDPCRPRYVRQGMAPGAGGNCIRPPRRTGLLVRTDSTC
ncbi:non-reducing end alpha-L-arabinofuranosidase family hydrolase [Streptomyces sp. NPDC057433]|uniref:non-reducing end alpha-L-arabinofuranosidase family hydrolase n=1 Tax=Streptomyces sp. NPDC057433 TaxID=3346132 RepID=UPI0036AD4BCA